MAWRTSPLGIDLIKKYEGLRLRSYRDSAGKWTIGYGHTRGVGPNDFCSQGQAEAWLLEDAHEAEDIINAHVTASLSQSMFDALVSFVFNIGPGKEGEKDGFVMLKNGNPSSLLRLLNATNYQAAAAEFKKWVHADGKVLPGLVSRREEESALFLSEQAWANVEKPIKPTPAPVEPAPSASTPNGASAQDPTPVPQETVYGVAVEQAPAPVEERGFEYKEKPPVAPFIAAAIPALIQQIPEIIGLFGAGGTEVSDRNIRVAEKVVDVVQKATGTPNAQAAVEKIQSDPQAAAVARDAVRAEWYDILQVSEIGKGGIAGARAFAAANVNTRYGRVLEMVSYAAIGLLIMANVGVGFGTLFAIHKNAPEAQMLLNLGSMIIQADIASAFTAFGFWLGSSVAKQRVPETPAP